MAKKSTARKGGMRSLARRKLDEAGDALRKAGPRISAVPTGGWIAAIREALGMSASDFAARMGVSPAAITKLEANERRRTIQVDTLQRAAAALECELVYALVPRKPLQEIVDEQRLRVLSAMHARTQQHMRLEAQEVTDPDQLEHLRREAESLIPDDVLWRPIS